MCCHSLPAERDNLFKYMYIYSSIVLLQEMGLMAHHQLWFTALSLVCLLSVSFVTGTGRFTIINKCTHPVWPGVLANAGSTPLSTTGFLLQEGESVTLSSPPSWSGRFWGRTRCTTQGYSTTGTKFACATGDCGSNTIECSGAGATPPATLAEFTLNGADGLDFYDVSLVDGYNLPMLVAPQQLEEESRRSSGNCSSTGCLVDINSVCPKELRLRLLSNEDESDSLACKSACDAFEQPEYCCSGEYANPQTCKPSSYSELFKKACPLAYSYAYDDGTSTFTCSSSPNYAITFCPPLPSSQKSSQYPEASSLRGGEDGSVANSCSDERLLHLSIPLVLLTIWHIAAADIF